MENVENVQSNVIYRDDKENVQRLLDKRKKVANICRECLNRPVRVETLDGQRYEGIITDLDQRNVYLSMAQPGMMQGGMGMQQGTAGMGQQGMGQGIQQGATGLGNYGQVGNGQTRQDAEWRVPFGGGYYGAYGYPYYGYNPYYNTILPLVLFDLLAITLL